MRRGIAATCVAAGLFWAMPSAPARAQTVLVTVTAFETGRPIAGAFVSLIDESGRVVRSALTNEVGQLRFSLAATGTFQVKAETIGRETRQAFLAVGAGEAAQAPLALPLHAIPLSAIRVEGEGRCRLRPAEASEIARVWDAARKPLSVQAWAEQSGAYRLDIATWERDLDATAARVEREDRRQRNAVTRTPFASLSPTQLLQSGFVRPVEGGGYQYYGPDAGLLLSDEFLNTHCFRITRSRDLPGSIGLTFEPVRATDRADITGTLWLDEQTAALRHLEFRYTWAPFVEAEGLAGGRLEFDALPDGAWIITRWWIRAPLLARHANLARAGDSGVRVTGIRETGGEVARVTTLDGRPIAQAPRGSLRGTVWDSTRARPLAGAKVFLTGTGYTAETDHDGRFLLALLPEGVFTVGFTHPRLDSLHVAAPALDAAITTGAATEIALAIPSASTLLLAACRAEEREQGAAVISGVVRDRAAGQPIPGVTVRVEWQEVSRLAPIALARDRWIEVGTDADGRYTACGIPVDEAVRVRASLLGHHSAVVAIRFDEETHATRDLVIALPAADAAATRVASATTETGLQGVQGLLLEAESGSPIRSAAITIHNLAGNVVASDLTNERGFFRVRAPAPGRYLLSAQALGYGSLAASAVDVTLGHLTVLEIRMAPEALTLEPIVATAEPRAFHLEVEGFYRRQREGLGVFLSPDVFERRKPRRVSDLLFGLPGTYVAEPTTVVGGRAVYFRTGVRNARGGATLRPEDVCWPMVYVNRQLVSTGGLARAGAEPTAVDEIVATPDVWALEVYRSPAEIPSEFNGPNAGCGVIVLWTRRGGSGG